MRQRWPSRLWLVRHGQSAGNVAREAAESSGHAMIDLPHRDVDVPLSELGHRQADALGDWFAKMPEDERPEVVLSSPYVRAQQTAQAVCKAGGVAADAKRVVIDERLREREFGILDRLTTRGIQEKYPDQAEHRALLGKFYHRPPGGESWADVTLRLRSALDSISLHYADKRVLIACHQVVVLCFRYILEEMTEAEVIKVSRESNVLNCGVCEYAFDRDHEDSLCTPRLVRYNHSAPLLEEHAPLTAEPEEIMGAR